MRKQIITCRSFIRNSALASGGLLVLAFGKGHFPGPSQNTRTIAMKVSGLEIPLAIAMWDYSWRLCHHRYGEFEDWGRVLEGLRERGYNAIRIDVMSQFVARGTDGKLNH